MNPETSSSPGGASEEVSALIETLLETGQRLEALTAGEVDTVAGRDGRTFLLHHAQERLRGIEATKQAAILNALPANIALLDTQGRILSVNETWRKFGRANAAHAPGHDVGVNYLAVCDLAHGEDAAEARQVAAGIRSVLTGAAKTFSLEYPCHSPTEQRWFQMTVTPMAEGHPHGVAVMHLNVTKHKRAEDSLRELTQELLAIYNGVADGILVADTETKRFVSANTAICNMLGYTREELLQMRAMDIHTKQDLPYAMKQFERLMRNEIQVAGNVPMLRKDGSVHYAEIKGSHIHIGGKACMLGLFSDITERKLAEDRITYLNRVYALLSGINTLIVRVRDRDEIFREACRIAVDAGGFRMALIGMVDQDAMNVVPAASAGASEELLAAIKSAWSLEKFPSTMAAGVIRDKTTAVSSNAQSDPNVLFSKKYTDYGIRSMAILPLIIEDKAIGVFALCASEAEFFHADELKLLTELAGDIAFAIDHIKKQERLDYLAYYDPLTGLANQPLFLERLQQKLLPVRNGQRKIAVFVLDIERFRSVNEAFGRQAGDALLKQVAERIVEKGDGDVSRFARIGVDRFAVVTSDIENAEQIGRYTEQRLEASFREPFRVSNSDLRVSVKVGIALFPDDGTDAETLLRNAEAALKKSKATGERYLFFTPSMTARVAERLSMENKLRQAIEKDEFVLYYQPKVNLVSGKVTSVEALIRWNDPQTGLVPPVQFIPLLEETGLIHEVGRWALRQAIADYLRWRATGLAAVRVAVNVSPLQLRDRNFVAEITQVIGIDTQAAAGLELEITESLIMEDVKHSIESLKTIRALGVTIAIDDFGTGFSSLSYLAKLPVDTLKIDRSFILDMTTGPDGLALMSTIINLAHSLKLKVVAEGVDSEEQSRLLRLLSCDEMQGYLFSKPVPSDIFEATFLRPSSGE